MKPIIQLKNTKVVYRPGKSNETVAIDNVSLDIYEGEYIIFYGQSGSGKSTLLYIISGLERAVEGQINIDGLPLHKLTDKDKIMFYRNTIGMIFQAFYLVPHLTAKDNVMLSKMFFGVKKSEREKKAEELMHKFQLSGVADRKPVDLSGGQQQRVAIARSLMNDPKIILADEPTGNLDTKNAEIVQELLADINQRSKKTIIQVTHNPRDLRYADRVFYIKDGKVERIAVNASKLKSAYKPDGTGTELDKLANKFPDLSRERLKAKLIIRQLLMPYDIDTEDYIENSIEKYIKREMDKNQLIKFLDGGFGAGLYSQKANSLANDIEKLVNQIAEINTLERKASSVEKTKEQVLAEKIRMDLLDSSKVNLTYEQVKILDQNILDYINKEIDRYVFQNNLDKPIKEGGVGLNKRTVKEFMREVDLLIIDK